MFLRAASALKGTKCGPSWPDVSTWQMFHLWLGPAHGLLNSILLDRKPQTLTPPPREPSEGSLRKGHARLTWLLLQRSPRAITMWPLFTRALWAAGATGLGSCGVQKGRCPQKLLSTQIAHGVSGEGKGAMSAGSPHPVPSPAGQRSHTAKPVGGAGRWWRGLAGRSEEAAMLAWASQQQGLQATQSLCLQPFRRGRSTTVGSCRDRSGGWGKRAWGGTCWDTATRALSEKRGPRWGQV